MFAEAKNTYLLICFCRQRKKRYLCPVKSAPDRQGRYMHRQQTQQCTMIKTDDRPRNDFARFWPHGTSGVRASALLYSML